MNKLTQAQLEQNFKTKAQEIEAKQYLNYWLKMRGLTQADITGKRKGKKTKARAR